MANSYFRFKQFTIHQDRCAMKVTTDGCLFGAWVAEQVKSESKEVKRLLDIGGGTGLLSLMIAQANPKLAIDAVELDNAAYEQAKENVAHSPWHHRINVIHADIKQFSSSASYDIIISNPPFYEKELKSGNSSKNKAHHDEGLLLTELLSIIKKQLRQGGEFYLLLPYKRKEDIKTLAQQDDLDIFKSVFVKQSPSHSYFRLLISGRHAEKNIPQTMTDELIIRKEQQHYTPEFVNLLKDYYLHL